MLAALLIGYMFLGKGFAYLSVGPIYIGDFVLFITLFLVCTKGYIKQAWRYPTAWFIVLFGLWGAARTLPFLEDYGLDACRDAVTWSYAAFTLIVLSTFRADFLSSIPRIYSGLAMALILWLPIAAAIQRWAPWMVPDVPGTDVPLLMVRGGDAGVHLAGCASFFLLNLTPGTGLPWWRRFLLHPMVWAPLWVAGMLLSAGNRASFVAAAVAISITFLLAPNRRRMMLFFTVILLSGILGFALDVKVDVGRSYIASRDQVSVSTIVDDFRSLVDDEVDSSRFRESSKQYRLRWWRAIIDNTFGGENLWTGTGFGPEIGFKDPTVARGLRSPHNGHLTILARTGLPGLTLWFCILLMSAAAVFRAYRQARRTRNRPWALLDVWILSYCGAALANTACDVYLEGPQGGIWLWSLIGFALAAARHQTIAQASRYVQNFHGNSGSEGQLVPAT